MHETDSDALVLTLIDDLNLDRNDSIGAGVQQDGQIYYDPEVINVDVGTTVVWDNVDSTLHTVTSGTPSDGPDGLFDSSIISAGDTYKYTFDVAGPIDYFCIVHPWMVGTVNVE